MAKMSKRPMNWSVSLSAVHARTSSIHLSVTTLIRRTMQRAKPGWRYRHAFELRSQTTGDRPRQDRWCGTCEVRIDWNMSEVPRADLRLWSTSEARWRRVCARPTTELPTEYLVRLDGSDTDATRRAVCETEYREHLLVVEQELLDIAVRTLFGASCELPKLVVSNDLGGPRGPSGPPPQPDSPEAAAFSKDSGREHPAPRSGEVSFSFDGLFKDAQERPRSGCALPSTVGATPADHETKDSTPGPFQLEGGRCVACGEVGGHTADCPAHPRSGPVAQPEQEAKSDAQRLKSEAVDSSRGRDGSDVSADDTGVGRLEDVERALSDLLLVAGESTDGGVRAQFEQLVTTAGADADDPIGAVVARFCGDATDAFNVAAARELLGHYSRITMDAWARHGDILDEDDSAQLWHERLESLLCVLGNYYEDEHPAWEPAHGMMLDSRTSGPCVLQAAEEVDPGGQNAWACKWLVGPPGRSNPEVIVPSEFAQLTGARLAQKYRPARKLKV